MITLHINPAQQDPRMQGSQLGNTAKGRFSVVRKAVAGVTGVHVAFSTKNTIAARVKKRQRINHFCLR